MKKLIVIVVMCLLFFDVSYAKKYKLNDVVQNEFYLNKNFIIDLPEGKWVVAEKSSGNYYQLVSKIYTLVRLLDNRAVEAIEIGELKTAGVYQYIIDQAIYESLFKNKYDGCYERPEYSLLEFYKKGSTHNCFWLGHTDLYKDLFAPEDPNTKNAKLKKWITQNNIDLPKVTLFSNHAYFSRLKAGNWYLISYHIDPNELGAPKNKYIAEETSEYHKNNIDNHPEHKKVMKKWISISAQRHIDFENSIKVIERHKLSLDKFNPIKSDLNDSNSNDIIDQLQKLDDLFKNGVLTEEEFIKAKKKLLK